MTAAQETELCAWLDERFCRSTVEIRAHIAAQHETVPNFVRDAFC